MKQISNKKTLKLIQRLSNLEPVEFIGFCRLFGVSIVEENGTPKDFYEILDELIEAYVLKERKFRKEADAILCAAVRKED